MPQLSHRSVKDMSYSQSSAMSLRILIWDFAGLKAFSNLREQRSSQIRQPVQAAELTAIGGPFLVATNANQLLSPTLPALPSHHHKRLMIPNAVMRPQPWPVPTDGTRNNHSNTSIASRAVHGGRSAPQGSAGERAQMVALRDRTCSTILSSDCGEGIYDGLVCWVPQAQPP
jgi:hypothetical protein